MQTTFLLNFLFILVSSVFNSATGFDVVELGAVGPAEVTYIGDCPKIFPAGRGHVVIGRFKHEAGDNLVNVYIEGQSMPIGATDNHPIWSVSHRTFVPAGHLTVGDWVKTRKLGEVQVLTVTKRPREDLVFNLFQ